MENKHRPYGPYEKYFKRWIDLMGSVLAILLFWWIYAIIAVLIKVKLGSPVLFSQERSGKDGKVFKLYKFRSMTDARGEDGNLLSDDERLTKFGRLLRTTSLDELPELLNIVKGEMSLIGPRPLLTSYLSYYTDEEGRRHNVRPGLSGLAQVNGRNALTWEEKFKWDLEYVNKITFWGDVKIMFQTVYKTFRRSDILMGKQFKTGRLDVIRSKKEGAQN